jgi:hypothetical protein
MAETIRKKRGPVKGTKYHSDFEKEAAMILLAKNQNDFAITAEQLGITERTLYEWQKLSFSKKEALPVLLEMAIKKMLDMMPDKWTGNSWAIAFGIMMDKWLLVNGQPTQRTENILTDIDNMNEKEKDAILAEAERIIQSAVVSRGTDSQETI